MKGPVQPLAWILGETPTPRTVVAAGVLGAGVAVAVVLASPGVWWMRLILLFLAFDLAAGLVSNLSASTRAFWRARPRGWRWAFIVLHASVYPLAIWSLAGTGAIMWILLAVLLAKIAAFSANLRTT
ncbi:MAG: hypothetical protein KGS47_06105 [Chloroflexi bacterium]|nr:hypothetical protein [Chloroflexota bacterium]